MKTKALLLAISALFVVSVAISIHVNANEPRPLKNMLIINEDNSRYLGSVSPDNLTVEELQKFVDSYAATKVTHLFLCPNAMRANFNSSVWTPIWAPWKGVQPTGRWAANAKLLSEKGIDPYTVWLNRCRERGLGAWLSMRMNDLHNVDDFDNLQHSDFWRAHPQFWRVPNASGQWGNWALNFAHPEVREYTFSFIKELFERYDFDGLELDWMRFPYHLTPGKEEQEAYILTDFMKRVRQLCCQWEIKRGHKIYLGARVPTHPDAARGLGMDGITWAKEGLIDLLVPSPFFSSSDYDIPVELWKERLGKSNEHVALAVGYENGITTGHSPRVATTSELSLLYGFASAIRARGCDNFYLFNWMHYPANTSYTQNYQQLLQYGLSNDVIHRSKQSIPITYHDTCPKNMSRDMQLPQRVTSKPAKLSFHVGTKADNAKVSVLIGFESCPTDTQAVAFDVSLNGKSANGVREIAPNPKRYSDSSKWILEYSFDTAALRDGTENIVEIKQAPSNAANTKISAVWSELIICP